VYKTLRQIAEQKGQGSAARRQQAILGMLRSCRYMPSLKHLHNVETPFDCPQTSLSVDFQCRDGVSELKWTFWDETELTMTVTMNIVIVTAIKDTVMIINGTCGSLLGFKLASSLLPACGVQPGYCGKPRPLLPPCVQPSANMPSAKVIKGKAEQVLAPHAHHQQYCLSHTACQSQAFRTTSMQLQASSTCPIPLDSMHYIV